MLLSSVVLALLVSQALGGCFNFTSTFTFEPSYRYNVFVEGIQSAIIHTSPDASSFTWDITFVIQGSNTCGQVSAVKGICVESLWGRQLYEMTCQMSTGKSQVLLPGGLLVGQLTALDGLLLLLLL
jgi:hypothetical protein